MRRQRVELWIGEMKADLSDDGLILFNWTFEDAGNPTSLINSYSQQVTLPGTSANDKIFGFFWRSDRVTTANGNFTGTDFDARKRVPFTIFADTGDVLQAGYVRLDNVARSGRGKVSYKVTLFGDLGNFVQALSVNGDGSAMTLADLAYIDGNDDELDFVINANTVKTAWTELDGGTPSDLWATVNFCPAYEGIPDKDFDAAKAIAYPADVGVRQDYTDGDGNYYTTKSSRTLLNLAGAVDQWAAKDFRSYLQRPVVNFGRVLDGIVAKAADAGFTLDLSTLTGGQYDPDEMWLTLKPLTSLAPKEVTTATITPDGGQHSTNDVGYWTIVANDVPAGSKCTASVNFRIALTMSSTMPAPSLIDTGTRYPGWHDTARSVMFVKLVARSGGSGGVIVGQSKVLAINAFPEFTPLSQYNYCRGADSGLTDADFYAGCPSATLSVVDATTAKTDESYALTVEAHDADYVGLVAECYILQYSTNSLVPQMDGFTGATSVGALPTYFRGGSAYLATQWTTAAGSGSDSVSFDVPSTVRSGARITKRMLLGSTKTPAEYLLSLAKALGLCFAVDDATKTVTLCKRGEFFNGSTGDLTGRVDPTTVSIVPVSVESRIYEFSEESKGKFADAYAETYGAAYGSQRVDTGYEFNDEAKQLLSSSAFRSAVTALERSKYFNYIIRTGDSSFCPSPFLDSGVTQTLWTTEDESAEIPVPVPAANAVLLTYYNTNGSEFQGYDADFARKLQLHSADGKQVDGEDVLVFLESFHTYEWFGVSDDTALMYEVTGGKACWVFAGTSMGVTVPIFGRMKYSGGNFNISATLDFGRVKELAMPYTKYKDSGAVTLYERCWRDYLLDRLDKDARVVTAKVQLRGLPTGQGLLRRFWWWDGALWAMNKVKNHSVTTEDPTEVELVKVMDADDYTNGQDLT